MQLFFSPTYKHQRSVFFGDLLIIFCTVFLSHWLFEEESRRFFPFVWLGSTILFLYLFGRYAKGAKLFSRSGFLGVFISLILSLLLCYPFMSGSDKERVSFSLFLFFLSAGALLLQYIFFGIRTSQGLESMAFFSKKPEKYRALLEDMNRKLQSGNQHIETLQDVDTGTCNEKHDFILIDESILQEEKLSSHLLQENIQGTAVSHIVDAYAEITGRVPVNYIDTQWIVANTSNASKNSVLLRLNRAIDIFVGFVGLLFFFLPMAVISMVIKVDSKGPIIFAQERLGLNKKTFVLYKFRSMKIDAEMDGPKWAVKNDSRTTKFGVFLRASHLDELPQLFNLLKGDMTLVGPRPIRAFFAEKLAAQVPYYNLRFLVKPGITGWAQVKGPYGSTMEEQQVKVEMDLFFLIKLSPLMNFFILVDTIKTIFQKTE